jgi:hypothetical protein
MLPEEPGLLDEEPRWPVEEPGVLVEEPRWLVEDPALRPEYSRLHLVVP